MFGRKSKFEIKTPDQFLLMRKAGLVVADVLTRMQLEAVPGVTTEQLDRIAREMLKAAGAESSFLGYFGYPSVI
jgi:methionyl aminopeptidase